MNKGTWGGEIIRTKQEVRETQNSRVTNVFMKLPNEDNAGFAFMSVDAWNELAVEVADLPQGSYLEFEGRVNTRSYEENGKKVYFTSLVVQEIIAVEIPKQGTQRNTRNSSSRNGTSSNNSRTGNSSSSNNGRSPRR